MYRERMNSYYPQVIQSILEFQAIIDSEYPEFEGWDEEVDGELIHIEGIAEGAERVINDAYLTTMSEDRIEQWENMLGIQPIEGSSVSDRRETVIARIRGQGKLNTNLINIIVGTFTGGTANSWVKDGVLYVEITPPPNNKQYQFSNVEQELKNKIPAHLGLRVERNYYTWGEIEKTYATWGDVETAFDKWEDVLLFVPFETEVYNR